MAEIKKAINLIKLGEGLAEKAQIGAAKTKNAISASAQALMQSIDQTGDGKFDFEDVNEIKRQIQEKQRQEKLRRDVDALNPVFAENLTDGDFFLPKMVRLAEMDKKHASSSVCNGAIGHETLVKDMRVVTIYPDKMDVWGLQFYPDVSQELYYVDPINPARYIAVNTFFDYLRQVRVGELQRIAQDLGATYFRVTIKEQSKTLRQKSGTIGAALNATKSALKLNADGQRTTSVNELSDGEIAAQVSFEGHAPVYPKLQYYENEPQIKALVEMRLGNTENSITEQHLALKCTRSSGITEKTAASIDAAFGAIKVKGKGAFVSEAKDETKQIFIYDIVF